MSTASGAELAAHLHAVAEAAGLDAFAIASAQPFDEARLHIEERKARGLHAGMSFTYGHPDRSTDPSRIVPGARSLLVGALDHHRDPPADAAPGSGSSVAGAVARYAWEPYYERLRAALGAVADELIARGWRAEVVADDNRLVDRAAAHRAGLGWFGKNTLLLLEGAGSWFVLGSVVTDCPLPVATDAVPDGCGTCVRCQLACPTGALDVAGELDANRCLAWLVQADGVFPREHRVALGGRIYGCDDCQVVCPPNVRHIRRRGARPAGDDAQVEVDLVALLDADDDALTARLGHWYIPRRRPEYLRRNALVVLANVADPADPDVGRVVLDALGHPSGVVRAHAVWAARRLGLTGPALDALAEDHDDMVAAELAAEVEVRPSS